MKLIAKEEEEHTAPKLKLITGGKGPPDDPNNPDWLSELDNHTTFLAQNKKDTTFALGQFTIVLKGEKAILVLVQGSKEPVWVDPVRFTRDFRRYEIIQTGAEYDLEAKANLQLEEEPKE